MKVIIAGAGIGGLTAAIALIRQGIQVEIYERSPALREVGAGLGLWPNGVKALHSLGLADRLQAMSLPTVNAALRRWNGAYIAQTSAREMERRFGSGMILVHRAELLNLLAESVGSARIHLSHSLTLVSQDPGQVSAHFTNQPVAVADVLIGADGLHSQLRTQLGHLDPLRYAGYTVWRSVVPFRRASLIPGETWGPGKRFGAFPLPGNRVYWFATCNSPEAALEPAADPKPLLLSLFQGWHRPVEALLQAADNSTILRNDVYDREPSPKWGHGRITLLGDAAHPMTPDLAQGAGQAIEDALVLARCLARTTDVEAALRKYEAERIPRTSRIVRASRRLGTLAQWEGPVRCWLRDKILERVPDSITYRGLAPIIGYEGHLAG